MRFVFISDTHSNPMALPPGDVLIHAGDHTNDGGYLECEAALRWLGQLDYDQKYLIPGNHDMLAEKDPDCWAWLCERYSLWDLHATQAHTRVGPSPRPWQTFHGGPTVRAFAESPASERATSVSTRYGAFQYLRAFPFDWGKIPHSLDLLVTHGPPEGIGDLSDGVRFGCPELRNALNRMPSSPKLHVFGHNHEEPGHWQVGSTLFCNVSTNHGNGPATVLDFDTSTGAWTFVSGPTTTH